MCMSQLNPRTQKVTLTQINMRTLKTTRLKVNLKSLKNELRSKKSWMPQNGHAKLNLKPNSLIHPYEIIFHPKPWLDPRILNLNLEPKPPWKLLCPKEKLKPKMFLYMKTFSFSFWSKNKHDQTKSLYLDSLNPKTLIHVQTIYSST